VIDAQGFQAVVTLINVDLNTKPDPGLFHIDENFPKMLGRGGEPPAFRWPIPRKPQRRVHRNFAIGYDA